MSASHQKDFCRAEPMRSIDVSPGMCDMNRICHPGRVTASRGFVEDLVSQWPRLLPAGSTTRVTHPVERRRRRGTGACARPNAASHCRAAFGTQTVTDYLLTRACKAIPCCQLRRRGAPAKRGLSCIVLERPAWTSPASVNCGPARTRRAQSSRLQCLSRPLCLSIGDVLCNCRPPRTPYAESRRASITIQQGLAPASPQSMWRRFLPSCGVGR